MMEGNVAGYQDRQPLFPGGACYPLSGEGDKITKDERLDQLSVIFRVLGTPSKEDIDVVDSWKANEYIESLGQVKATPLESLYPAADPLAIDLLKQMLQFNPNKRCTAEQALEHPFFKGVRRKELELNADETLTGPDFLEMHQVDIDMLKREALEECKNYAPVPPP
jgi:mitogen-activated protein kinase 1/3